MNGTVGTRILGRSIIKHIPGDDLIRNGYGQDFVILDTDYKSGRKDEVNVAAYGYSSKGRVALIRANNNLLLSGAAAESITVCITCGRDCPEQTLRREMHALVEFAGELGIRVLGGNTIYSGEGSDISIIVTAYGKTSRKTLDTFTRDIHPDYKIIAVGNAGEYGASLIYKYNSEDLGKRFSKSYIEKNRFENGFTEKDMDISGIAGCLIGGGSCYIHDVTFGGIYRALYEMSEAAGLGIDIWHDRIPIKQSTIEVSEFYGINPYMLLGTGAVAAVISPELEEEVLRTLEAAGYKGAVIGRFTEEKTKVIRSERYEMNRSLTMYEEDEIYKILKI